MPLFKDAEAIFVAKVGQFNNRLTLSFFTGQLIANVAATDKDQGLNALISYQITSGDTGKFTIDSNTGTLTTSAKLDREEASSYRLIVTAKDHGTPSLSSTVVVTVTVLDENDNTPQFSSPFYKASVLENTAIMTNVLHVTATDPDDGENGIVTFSIVSGNANDAFVINNATGFIAVNRTLDREALDSYSLYIRASDNAVSNPRRAFVRVNFTVLDENDNSPRFVNVQNFSVIENAKSGTVVGSVSATDSDAGRNGEVRFSIVKGNDGNVFQIDPISGQITVNGAIDREMQASYKLTVMASDRGNPQMKTKQTFYVTVQDENDNSPEFDARIFRGLYNAHTNSLFIERFSIERRKTNTKLRNHSGQSNANTAKNQSELEENACNQHQARETRESKSRLVLLLIG